MSIQTVKKRSLGFCIAALVLLISFGIAPCAAVPETSRDMRLQSVQARTQVKASIKKHLISIMRNVQDKYKKLKEKYPNASPDELDMRVDYEMSSGGGIEIGFGSPLESTPGVTVPIREITLKHPTGMEFSLGVGGTWDNPVPNGIVKMGYAREGAVEGKYGIEIDLNKSTDDFYDGEWQKESEWTIVRNVENLVAKMDFYVGGAAGVKTDAPGGAVTVGPEVSWNLRERYTNLIFNDMYSAMDRLEKEQSNQKEWRRKKIVNEARHLGIDPTDKTNQQLINEIHQVWKKHPGKRRRVFKRPRPQKNNGQYVTLIQILRDWYCTNRPQITIPVYIQEIIKNWPPTEPLPDPRMQDVPPENPEPHPLGPVFRPPVAV